MQKALIILVFFFLANCMVAQKDSLRKNHFSLNLAAITISGEAGLYYDRRLPKNWAIQISFGHRFWNFNVIQHGGYSPSYKILPQTGDVIRLGLKKFLHTSKDKETGYQSFYITGRLSYWYLHTPKYCKRYGSNGYNSILRETISVDKNVGHLSIGAGKEFYSKKHFYYDFSYCLGLGFGQKRTHVYSYGNSGSCNSETNPDNYFRKSFTILPTFELACKIGFSI